MHVYSIGQDTKSTAVALLTLHLFTWVAVLHAAAAVLTVLHAAAAVLTVLHAAAAARTVLL